MERWRRQNMTVALEHGLLGAPATAQHFPPLKAPALVSNTSTAEHHSRAKQFGVVMASCAMLLNRVTLWAWFPFSNKGDSRQSLFRTTTTTTPISGQTSWTLVYRPFPSLHAVGVPPIHDRRSLPRSPIWRRRTPRVRPNLAGDGYEEISVASNDGMTSAEGDEVDK